MDKKNTVWIIAAALVLAVFAGVAFVMKKKPAQAPSAPPQSAEAPQKPADAPLPPAGQSDVDLRKQLAALSPRPELGRWLSVEDLLDRWVVTVDNLAEDASPRKQLNFLSVAPARRNSLDYKRYDGIADVIASVDAKGFAAVVRDLHPLLVSAYHKLGYPDRNFDQVAAKALQRLIDAPVVDGPVKLEPKGALLRFQDDKLEALGPVEKHLLRMGPRNTRLIQAKAKEIAAALDLRMAAH